MDEIVERINRADWLNAHATAARTWLLDLLSDERDVCMRAYHRLDDFLVNRNTPIEDYAPLAEVFESEGAVLIISFLLDILKLHQVAGTYLILDLIYDVVRNIKFNADETGTHMGRVSKANAMILAARELFLSFSEHPDRAIRMRAKLVLETIDNPIDEWGQYNREDE